jgi:hypothetical protein
MTIEEEYKKLEEKKLEEMKKTKKAYHKLFHRETWIRFKLPFAKKWLEENDKEWLEQNEHKNTMSETFR